VIHLPFPPACPSQCIYDMCAGVLQLWNVSQQQPLETLATGQGPAQTITFFTGSSKALITFQEGTVGLLMSILSPVWQHL
jgi:hypothetical protein